MQDKRMMRFGDKWMVAGVVNCEKGGWLGGGGGGGKTSGGREEAGRDARVRGVGEEAVELVGGVAEGDGGEGGDCAIDATGQSHDAVAAACDLN